jgi:hypothetical protein
MIARSRSSSIPASSHTVGAGGGDPARTADCATARDAVASKDLLRPSEEVLPIPKRPAGPAAPLAVGNPRFEPIAKPGGGVRWLTRLDPAGEVAYRAAVAPLAGRIERSLGPRVFASRTRSAPRGPSIAPWRPARRRWRRALLAAAERPPSTTAFAVADVRDCYGSIAPATLARVLGPEARHAVRLLRMLQEAGVRGLPIGPEPSVVLANAVLSCLDRSLIASGVHHVRWVDDLVLWGRPARIARALAALRHDAASLGLELHDRKTRVLADGEELRALATGGSDSSIIAAP